MSSFLRREGELLAYAWVFYTRLPGPRWAGSDPKLLAPAARYLPVLGLLLGATAAAVWWLAAKVWPPSVALLLSMATSILLTGALHEDGLADACDGFGGGFSREQTLSIMRDSRLGTFGFLGLGLTLALKFFCLSSLPLPAALSALLLGHTLSRLMALSLLVTDGYAAESGKVRDAVSRLKFRALLPGMLAVAVAVAVAPGRLWLCLPVLAVRFLLAPWCRRRLGGYTGDCLGAVQQLTELTVYLCLTGDPWTFG